MENRILLLMSTSYVDITFFIPSIMLWGTVATPHLLQKKNGLVSMPCGPVMSGIWTKLEPITDVNVWFRLLALISTSTDIQSRKAFIWPKHRHLQLVQKWSCPALAQTLTDVYDWFRFFNLSQTSMIHRFGQHSAVMQSTAEYSTVNKSKVQFNTAEHSRVQYCIVPYFTLMYSTELNCTLLN